MVTWYELSIALNPHLCEAGVSRTNRVAMAGSSSPHQGSETSSYNLYHNAAGEF